MTDPAVALEHGYRRLLAWFPRGFRHEQGDEMPAVLTAVPVLLGLRWMMLFGVPLLFAVAVLAMAALRRPGVEQGPVPG